MIQTENGLKKVPPNIDTSELSQGDELYAYEPQQLEDGTVMVPFELDSGEMTTVPYVPKVMLEETEAALRQRIAAAEGVVESLREQLRRKVDPEDYETPCPFCGLEVEKDQLIMKSNCCPRVSHIRCCLQTVLRNPRRIPEDKCPHCLLEESRDNTRHIRATLIGEYNASPERDDPPSNRAMLQLCNACGHLKHMKAHLNTMWKWNQKDADEVYSVYISLTLNDLYEAGLTISRLNEMGIRLYHLVRDFNVKRADFFEGGPTGHGLDLSPTDIPIAAEKDAAAFVAVGMDVTYMKMRGLSLQKLLAMNLGPEPMCILGVTVMELILLGLQKDRIRRFEKVRLEEWIHCLGLDRRCIFLLGLKEGDFRPRGDLALWDLNVLTRTLRLAPSEINTLIERQTQQRPQPDSAPIERLNLQIRGAAQNPPHVPKRKPLKK